MKSSTIARIIHNTEHNRVTVIGRYTYRANLCTGVIERIATDDIGRIWIDAGGVLFDGWCPIYAIITKA